MDLISKQTIIDRLDYVIEKGVPDSNGLHPLSAEAVRGMVEQLPPANISEFPNSSDTISRKAAITAIDNYGCDGVDSCGEPWIYKENAVEAIEMVEPLPPAQRGLEDAWEAARKIVVDTDNGGIALGTLGEIFGTRAYSCIMRDNTAQEAIAKLKAYEDKQKDSIEVGDEVIASCGKAVVTAINNNFVYYLYSGGDCGANEVGHLTKTGKHYDIASILEAMRK